MQSNSEKVFRGWLVLNPTGKQEVINEINRYIEGEEELRESIRKSYEVRVDIGPLGGGCPCCGR